MRLSGYRLAVASLFVSMLIVSLPVGVEAQAPGGALFLHVVDQAGGDLPGVTLTLSGSDAPRVGVSDAGGSVRFLNLPIGSYSVSGELAGLPVVERNDIGVSIGENVTIEIRMGSDSPEPAATASSGQQLDPRKERAGLTVTQHELQQIPSARDPWSVMERVPGIVFDRINVGSSESGEQPNFVSYGAGDSQTSWRLDGADLTDAAGPGTSAVYYDIDSFDEMRITTGGGDPRIRTAGVQLDFVTRRGTNGFLGSARYYRSDDGLQAETDVPSEASGYYGEGPVIDSFTDYGVEAGGPIVKDKLWIWGSWAKQSIENVDRQATGVTRSFGTNIDLEWFNAKLNWQINAANALSVSLLSADKEHLGRNESINISPESAWNQDSVSSFPTVLRLEGTHIFSADSYLTALASRLRAGFELSSDNGEGCRSIECGLSGPVAYYDYSTALWAGSYQNSRSERNADEVRLDGGQYVRAFGAGHELKFGLGYRSSEIHEQVEWPGQQYVTFLEGEPGTPGATGEAVMFRAGTYAYDVDAIDAYVGDTVRLGAVTIQAGLRYDLQTGSLRSGSADANPVIPGELPAISFDAGTVDDIDWSSVSPRLGVTWAAGADGRTLVRAAANRYVDQLGGRTVSAASPLNEQYLYFAFTDRNGDKSASADELDGPYEWSGVDPNDPGSAIPVNRWDPGIDPPRTDELQLGLERELTSDITVGLIGTYRKLTDFVMFRAEKTRGAYDWYTRDDYKLARVVTGTRPDGSTYSVDLYDLKSGVEAPAYFVITNRPGYEQEFKGLELSATKRMSNRWAAHASFLWQDWTQSVDESSIVDPSLLLDAFGCSVCDGSAVVAGNANGTGFQGDVFINSEWSYNLAGTYLIPRIETTLGFNLSGRQGYPLPYYRIGLSRTGAKRLLTDSDPAAYRLDDVVRLDLRLAKEFQLGPTGLTLSIDALNVTDEQTVTERVTRLNIVNTNRVSELQSPRVIRLGARLTF